MEWQFKKSCTTQAKGMNLQKMLFFFKAFFFLNLVELLVTQMYQLLWTINERQIFLSWPTHHVCLSMATLPAPFQLLHPIQFFPLSTVILLVFLGLAAQFPACYIILSLLCFVNSGRLDVMHPGLMASSNMTPRLVTTYIF